MDEEVADNAVIAGIAVILAQRAKMGLSVAAVLLFIGTGVGQVSANPKVFVLYRTDKSCVCIRTRAETKTLKATESRRGNLIYQVFRSRKQPTRVLFRVRVGHLEGHDEVKLWNYGISDEADFNGDGDPDFAWYGGDDTGSKFYLFLSSGGTYKKVDIVTTLNSEAMRRYHHTLPGIEAADGVYGLSEIQLDRNDAGLTLTATIYKAENPTCAPDCGRVRYFRLRVLERDFKD